MTQIKNFKEKFKNYWETCSHWKLYIIIALILLVILTLIFTIIFWPKTTANITKFSVGDVFDCTINSDSLVYDEETHQNIFMVNITAYNKSDGSNKNFQETNTTGYDENTPYSFEITEEESHNLSNEEIDKINEKTINEHNKETSKLSSLAEYVNINALQDSRVLVEPNNFSKGSYGEASNLDMISKAVKPKTSYQFCLAYIVKNKDDVTLLIENNNNNNEASSNVEKQEILFNLSKAYNKNGIVNDISSNNNQQKENNVNNSQIDFYTCTINLCDGWCLEKEGKASIKLKNSDHQNASLDIDYANSETADQLANETAAWNVNSSPISYIQISNRNYCYFTRPDGSFVMTTNSKSNSSTRLIFNNISIDDVKNFVENISFK